MLKRNDWDEKKCTAELYRLREGIGVDADADAVVKNTPIDPMTQSPARPDKMRSKKLKEEAPTRQSSRRKLMSRGALSEAGRSRPRVGSSSPDMGDEVSLGEVDDELERRASKRQRPNSSKTSLSRDQSNDSFDYDAKFQVIDSREVRKALKEEKFEESDEEEKQERHVAMIAQDTKK